MREIIAVLLPYEIYVWLISGIVVLGSVLYNISTLLKNVYQKKKTDISQEQIILEDTMEAMSTQMHQESTLEEIGDTLDITQKLLQNIEAESIEEKEVINKLQAMEREEDVQTEESNAFIEEKSESDYPSSTQEQENKTPYITPEIYNVNTNIEVINKQKSQFELLKHEVDNLKTRSLRVEYEKKLIEATIDFPDNVYFNTLLGDHYIENNDFKKAQTIYKKLHLQDEFDDKALYKLGVINLELGDVQAAEYLLNKAKELKPENPKYYQVLAEIKYNLEKIDECIELMEKAVDLRPTKFDYIEILGKLYKETDNIQLYYKTLLKMNALEPLNQRVRGELNKFQD